MTPSAPRRVFKKYWRWLLGLLAVILAWHALYGVNWPAVSSLLTGISPLAVLIIVIINLALLPLMTARWWLLLKTLGSPVSLLSICAYRTATNAVNYLTPGPHFGGEPLSVYLLHHRHGISLSSATTSVAVDRLLELLASCVVLLLCLMSLNTPEDNPLMKSQGLYLVLALLAVMGGTLVSLFSGGNPLSRAILLFKMVICTKSTTSTKSTTFTTSASDLNGSWIDIIAKIETMAEKLFRAHPYQFLLANLFSLCHWLGIFAEFWLMSFFLGVPLSLGNLAAIVMVARLAFLTPLPAGIGVLESALPWTTASLGLGSAFGVSLCLIIRFRDLIFSLAGLWLTMKYLTCHRKLGIISDNSEQ